MFNSIFLSQAALISPLRTFSFQFSIDFHRPSTEECGGDVVRQDPAASPVGNDFREPWVLSIWSESRC